MSLDKGQILIEASDHRTQNCTKSMLYNIQGSKGQKIGVLWATGSTTGIGLFLFAGHTAFEENGLSGYQGCSDPVPT
jgi:hypothetical protein